MDCRTARLVIAIAGLRTAELDGQDREVLDDHLRECRDCARLAETEGRADRCLGQAMAGVPEPPGLKARLHERLHAERTSWYRRWFLRRARDVAAAAAMLALVWLGYSYWVYYHRPVVDVANVVAEANDLRGQSSEQIERWFRQEYGMHVVLPRDFNYTYLVSRARQDFHGRPVARLLFSNGQNFAEVFVLSARQFDLEASLQHLRDGSGGIVVEIRRHPADPSIAYLIQYSGESLDWLVAYDQPAAT